MAKATAHCTCEICGSEFKKTTTKMNCQQADAWVKWAEENITVCSSCFGKQMHQEEKDAGLVAKVRTGNPCGRSDEVWIVLFGDTYPIKDDLKKCGAVWTDACPQSDGMTGALFAEFSMRRPMKRWAVRLDDLGKLSGKIAELEGLGFTFQFPSKESIATYRAIRAEVNERRVAEQAERKAALDALGPKPKYSDEIRSFFPDGTTGNRKFYGKAGKYRIYISGKEICVTDAQKAEMEKTLESRDAWEARKKEIMQGA